MSESKRKLHREEIAAIEAGHTDVSPALARFLTAAFLLLIFSVPLIDQSGWGRDETEGRAPILSEAAELLPAPDAVRQRWAEGGTVHAFFGTNAEVLRQIGTFETNLEDDSPLSKRIIPTMQSLLVGRLRGGTESVYCGRDGWLFFRPGIDYLWGPGFLDAQVLAKRARQGDENTAPPQPDPRKAILEFHQQLAERGIRLMLVPAPPKAAVHPEQFTRRMTGSEAVTNADYADFVAEMEAAGVLVSDTAPALVEARAAGVSPLFLKTDTHWTPRGVRIAAAAIAEHVRDAEILSETQPRAYVRKSETARNLGDIANMLDLPEGQTFYAEESVAIDAVADENGAPWKPEADSEVLLLGDSYANIYNLDAMGWGTHAGLAAQLSVELQQGVDVLVRNDAGAHATREQLSRDLSRGDDRLAGKKLVIWEFAARELAVGNWKTGYSMEVGEKRRPAANADAELQVRATIAAVTRPPKPGTVPYKDCVVALHLRPVEALRGSLATSEIVVFTLGMGDNEWLPPAHYEVGQDITLDLVPWDRVESKYGTYNRAELDDDATLLLDLYWAGEKPEAQAVDAPEEAPSTPTTELSLANESDLPESPWRTQLLPEVERLLAQETPVHVGQDGWLFFTPELRHLAVGDFWGDRAVVVSKANNLDYADPLPAILDFHRQLKDAGIELILMPVPPKASVQTAKVFDGLPDGALAATQGETATLKRWYARLREEGVQVVDLIDPFVAGAADHDGFYCRQDTHWNGLACAEAARLVAQALAETTDFASIPKRSYRTESSAIAIEGDLWRYLGDAALEKESVRIEKVWEEAADGPRAPGVWRESPVLLLTDSHGLVFHEGGDLFAQQAGLADHLAKELGFPIDLVAVRGSGATPTRMSLVRRRDNLAGKKAVVWAFTAREFTEATGGWRKLPVIQQEDVGDATQSPSALSQTTATTPGAEGPSEEALWRFSTANQPVQCFDAAGQTVYGAQLQARGYAHYTDAGAMRLQQGAFLERQGAAYAVQQVMASNAFAVEAYIQPHAIEQEHPIVFSLWGAYSLNQHNNRLVFVVGTSEGTQKVKLPPLRDTKPFHLLVSYGPKHGFQAFRNGEAIRLSGQVRGDLSTWQPRQFVFGNTPEGGRPWAGALEQVAVYAEEIDAVSAQQHYAQVQAIVAARTPLPQLHIRARLKSKSHVPTLEELSPYTENLTVFEYEVTGVLNGAYDATQKKLYVAHWAILDSQRAPWMLEVQPGAKVELQLQPFDANPQLSAVNLSDTVMTDFSLPLLYDAGGHSLGFREPLPSPGTPRTTKAQEPLRNAPRPIALSAGLTDLSVAERDRLRVRRDALGGWQAWRRALEPFQESVRARISAHKALYPSADAFIGDDRYLYSVGRLRYLLRQFNTSSLGPAVETMAQLSKDLAQRGIRLLVVPIPSNAEVYPDKVAGVAPGRPVSPLRAELMLSLLDREVEVLDLLPLYEEARNAGQEGLYRFNDPHWGSLGIQLAADAIAERLNVKTTPGSHAFTFSSRTIANADGGLVKDLSEEDRARYTNPDITITQVLDQNGAPFQPARAAPVLVLGDSYAVFYSDYGAGISAHLAARLGSPVSVTATGGGGPGVAQMLARKPEWFFENRSFFVLCFVARYLDTNYAKQWKRVPLRTRPPAQTKGAENSAADPSAEEDRKLRQDDIRSEKERIAMRVAAQGGWDTWNTSLDAFRDAVRRLPGSADPSWAEGDFFQTANSFLFRQSWMTSYFLKLNFLPSASSDSVPENGDSPFDVMVDLDRQLQNLGIDLIIVPIPPRAEVEPKGLFPGTALDLGVAPQRLRFLDALLRENVEALDVLPVFQQAAAQGIELSLMRDTHYSPAGAVLTAEAIAGRLERYRFTRAMQQENRYTTRRADYRVRIAPWKYLSESAQSRIGKYEACQVQQVLDNTGKPFEPDPKSPILLIGDSYTYVFGPGASLSAHLSKELGFPVAHIGMGAGGPAVPQRLARMRPEELRQYRVIIWAFCARYLAAPKQIMKTWRKATLRASIE